MYASDLKHRDASLEQKLQSLYALGHGRVIDLSFRPPYLALLEKFGSPQLELTPVIHVAGTNGKGSVIAMLRSILEAGGYKVHAYTSPHLIDFNERIYLAGKNISDDALEFLIDEAVELNGGHEMTLFEITTAMAFAAFARTPADILLLEVGMGGRLDCTNVIEAPLAAIITSTGFDHMEYLGHTLAEITAEKAGIIKPGAPCIVGAQKHREVLPVIEQIASGKKAPLIYAREKGLASNLTGAHQLENAAVALTALETIKNDFPLSPTAIETGLRNVHWPARLQDITARFKLPPGFEAWLDGAHNEEAARILAQQAQTWNRDGKPLHLVFGMLQGKNPRAFLKILQPHIAALHLVGIPGEPKALRPEDIQAPGPTHIHTDYRAALTHISDHTENARILIAGSLYLAGHVLKTLVH
ncbi:MAG: bifunctional folylpolyglutamate synthase/dihydrofolate synthase [Alphaproteobacteria bacterium]